MNQQTLGFLEELKQRPDVLGVILFGSWARGNNRPDSDVDLVIILTEGFQRTVEYRNGQAFEIIYTTAQGSIDFWKSHKDDCAGFWEVAKILYDKDSTSEKLKGEAEIIIAAGKKPIDPYQISQFKFSAEDELAAVSAMADIDPATANLVLQKTILGLSELFFDLRLLWTPAPKQRFQKIRENKPELYDLFVEFYASDKSMPAKQETAKAIIKSVFEN